MGPRLLSCLSSTAKWQPAEKHTHSRFEKLRAKEFARLDAANHVYLDHTGAALYPASLVNRYAGLLTTQVYGNPHSGNPTSAVSSKVVHHVRQQILDFFNASSFEYCVIFTANASAAIKLVAESFPFQPSSTLALLADNHNSVLGIREFAHAAQAAVHYIPLDDELRARSLPEGLLHLSARHPNSPNLLAYPAQSNFSGVKHDLSHISYAQALGWTVLLDAAAFVPTSPLDLSEIRPDFVAMSFYKIMGLPTGVGALIAKRSSLRLLRRPWFAGGTVSYASVRTGVYVLKEDDPEAFEDGTLNFLSILCLKDGFDFMRSVGMHKISSHINHLLEYLFEGFHLLRYNERKKMIRVYGPSSTERRGGCVAFDVLSDTGKRVDPKKVEIAASKRNISLRVGCFCNPGASEFALGRDHHREMVCLKKYDVASPNYEYMSTCLNDYLGCVRVSVGMSSTHEDLRKFLQFLHRFALDGV